MHFSHFLAACVAIPFASGFLVAPPTGSTAAPGTTTECSGWVVAVSGDTCTSITTEFGITLAFFEAMNPFTVLGGSCSLLTGFAFCVQENFGVTSTSTVSTITSTTLSTVTTTTATTTTTSGNGITTPTPFQAGMISSCNAFYLVVSGDQCGTIATQFGISLADFEAWNPAVGTTCEFLDLGDYVCVDIIGFTITTSVVPTTTGNGISTPTPIQTGMVTNCNSFHLVVSGDTCAAVAAAAGISLAQIEAWNPAVGSTCSFLDLGDYVCIGLIGGSVITTTTTTAPTTTGNGITTPTPFQTGMATNCDAFHLVVSGDTCAAVAASAGVSLANFEAWNPAVGTTCEFLDLGDYVCIDVVGVTPTTAKTSTTTQGNGVTTPTPFEQGMVSNCNSFHFVVSGDQCGVIATNAGITLAQFISWNPAVGSSCAFLDLGDYVCIGIL